MRKIPFFLIILATVLTFGLASYKSMLYGDAKLVTIASAAPLTGQISQALAGTSGDQAVLPEAGKDYTLENVKYFDNKEWVFAGIKPVSNTIDSSDVVLQKKNGVYVVVLGPGSAFSRTTTLTMPSDIAQYLNQQGLLYGSN